MAVAGGGQPPFLSPHSVPNSLKRRQIASLKSMLNLNSPMSKTTVPSEPVWKILIYDKYGQDIISPLMNVKELRSMAVTLYLPIDSSREPVLDAAAVYFVAPSDENIKRICRDLHNHLYDTYYFNFITPIPRPLLEELAKAAVDANCISQVTKVYDQYLNFISLEDDLFITRHQDKKAISYYALNRTDAKDTDITAIVDVIVESLFSVFVTAGVVPIIRCPRGNAADMIAQALDKKLRDNLRDPRSSMFTSEGMSVSPLGSSFTRPLLVILDRNMDLATPLHHTWTYQALAHDVFELELNRITIPPSDEDTSPTAGQPKSYDLHPNDRFWQSFRGKPFPEVADAVQREVSEYKAKEEELSRLKVAMGASNGDDPNLLHSDLSDSTAKLTSAITSLPELMEKKKSIDMHTNIATALLEEIKRRKLDLFFEMEDKMISKSSLDKSVLDVLTDESAGEPADKLRLFLIFYLLSQDISENDLTQYITVLEGVLPDISSVDYIKKWKAYTKMAANPRASKTTGTGASSSSMSTMIQQIYTSGSKMVEGVRNLVIRTKNLPVTRIVDQLMEMKGKDIEDYRYFDPKLLRSGDSIPKGRGPFQEAFVFVVGGGNYIEYQNLQDYCQQQQIPKRITYGTTELMDATEFLAQLSLLGKSSD